MVNKKGQEMSTSTLILIVIGVIVLALIVIGVSGGFNSLIDKVRNIGGSESNVNTIVQSCNLACSSGSKFDWCKSRDVVFNKTFTKAYTCQSLASVKTVGLSACSTLSC